MSTDIYEDTKYKKIYSEKMRSWVKQCIGGIVFSSLALFIFFNLLSKYKYSKFFSVDALRVGGNSSNIFQSYGDAMGVTLLSICVPIFSITLVLLIFAPVLVRNSSLAEYSKLYKTTNNTVKSNAVLYLSIATSIVIVGIAAIWLLVAVTD